MSKAFDTIDHKILLNKLYCYGIRGIAHSWLTSYLQNRQQYVSLDKIDSDLQTLKYGVPQGSILGPLLFLLYINDIINTSKIAKFIMFADDTNLFFSDKNYNALCNKVNLELENIVN